MEGNSVDMRSLDGERKISAWQSPWIVGMLIFMGVVVTVNVTMAYLAVTTTPGLVVKDFYQRGQNFEERTREERYSKNSLGWSMNVESPTSGAVAGKTTFRVVIRDKDGNVMKPDKVSFMAYRPSTAAADFSVPMASAGEGGFAADVTFPMDGYWDTIIEATHGDVVINTAKRVKVEKNNG